MGNKPEHDNALGTLSGAVADGAEVDWDEAETTAVNPAEHKLIRNLRIIDRIKEFYDSLDNSRPHDIENAPSPPPVASLPDQLTTPDGRTRTWGHFVLREKVGSGSYGTVYRAWEPRLEREVALKLLHPVKSSEGGAALIREARLLARIRHSNIVTIFGADYMDECVGLWMEFVEGRTLKAMVHEIGAFSAQEATLIGLDLCGALAAVHKAKLLHRDVKAQNVMRAAGGRIVLMDFGAAGAMNVDIDAVIGLTGTPLYLAPEVLGGAAPTEQSDLYSLGVLLVLPRERIVSRLWPGADGHSQRARARGTYSVARCRPGSPSRVCACGR